MGEGGGGYSSRAFSSTTVFTSEGTVDHVHLLHYMCEVYMGGHTALAC